MMLLSAPSFPFWITVLTSPSLSTMLKRSTGRKFIHFFTDLPPHCCTQKQYHHSSEVSTSYFSTTEERASPSFSFYTFIQRWEAWPKAIRESVTASDLNTSSSMLTNTHKVNFLMLPVHNHPIPAFRVAVFQLRKEGIQYFTSF